MKIENWIKMKCPSCIPPPRWTTFQWIFFLFTYLFSHLHRNSQDWKVELERSRGRSMRYTLCVTSLSSLPDNEMIHDHSHLPESLPHPKCLNGTLIMKLSKALGSFPSMSSARLLCVVKFEPKNIESGKWENAEAKKSSPTGQNNNNVVKWQPTPAFLPGESQGQRSLAGYSPRGP